MEQRSRKRGFSLFELVVVTVIIGALVAIATPKYQNSLMRYRVERAAKRLVTDFAMIRGEVRTLSESRSVLFNVGSDRYGVRNLNDLIGTTEAYIVDLSKSPYHVDIVSVDFGGDTTVIFNGYGIPDSGGTVVLQAGTIQKTVVLNADTAKAIVQ